MDSSVSKREHLVLHNNYENVMPWRVAVLNTVVVLLSAVFAAALGVVG